LSGDAHRDQAFVEDISALVEANNGEPYFEYAHKLFNFYEFELGGIFGSKKDAARFAAAYEQLEAKTYKKVA